MVKIKKRREKKKTTEKKKTREKKKSWKDQERRISLVFI